MFTPKNIQGALEELYDLCDPDYMVDMLVNYSEEFDDISPALLAKSFQKNAEMISEYRVLSSAGEGIDYQGKVLLNSRAVRLLSYVEAHACRRGSPHQVRQQVCQLCQLLEECPRYEQVYRLYRHRKSET